MTGPPSRREALKILGATTAGALIAPPSPACFPLGAPAATGAAAAAADIIPLTSTSGVFVPPRGRAYDKFSFDFPEPSVAFAGYQFGVLVFTYENVYGLDRTAMLADATDDGVRVTCNRLVWAGGQQTAAGRVELLVQREGDGVLTWRVDVSLSRPIKAITTVVRGIPRGRVSASGQPFFDPRDDELLFGYPFSGGDLFGPGEAGGMPTPLVVVEQGDDAFTSISCLDDRVRTKRFYLQPGEAEYRVETVHETEGWLSRTEASTPTWRLARATTLEAAVAPHFDHVARAYGLTEWEHRRDAPAWLRRTSLVLTLHGMHYTGYVFNDFARMLDIVQWTATQIEGDRVLAFLPSWDGRYYWDYPRYEAADRLGGEAGLRRLVQAGRDLGVRFMPMFGANAANRHAPGFGAIAGGVTAKIDGDTLDLNWVDWDNDRHQEGWLSYMNVGVDAWRTWLAGRIGDAIGRYGVDAYFLDIAGGWVNNPRADMHDGMRRLVEGIAHAHPGVLACGEMHYDALMAFIPLYQSFSQWLVREHVQRYARFFQHLSHPAPGRGSSGVHESGFNTWDARTLSLRAGQIPTLNVVDDTFTTYRSEMAAVIAKAKEGLGA
ncbi:MAG TPA: hypothetical protein VJO52_05405 [Gemmatimonadaceae bacterium]|nr:hypothetical protein [Gemmatimonadaceae bacterium]